MNQSDCLLDALEKTARTSERLRIARYLFELADAAALPSVDTHGVGKAVAFVYQDAANKILNEEYMKEAPITDAKVSPTGTTLLGDSMPDLPEGVSPIVQPRPFLPSTPGTNTGHGRVWKRPDGVQARCKGPGYCPVCSEEVLVVRNGTHKLKLSPS